MSSTLKPIKVYGRFGPNPPKIPMALGLLNIPYEVVDVAFADVKKPEYLAVNPNGRVPAIYDPNTDLTLWESGAILEYIMERYDTANQLSFPPGSTESYLAKQWLFFQVSGQGPYYGQAVWFTRYHPEKVPSAVERYVKEIARVTGVLEAHLSKQKVNGEGDGPWLVGDKMSFADFAFVPWQAGLSLFFKDSTTEVALNADDYPAVKKWLGNMLANEVIKKAVAPPS